jgi:hypothetical protein
MKYLFIALAFLLPGAAFAQVADTTPVTQDALTAQMNALKLELIDLLTKQLHQLEAQLEAQIASSTPVQSVSTSTPTPTFGSVSGMTPLDLQVTAEVGTGNGFLHSGLCSQIGDESTVEGSPQCPNDAGWVYLKPSPSLDRVRTKVMDSNGKVIGSENWYVGQDGAGPVPEYLALNCTKAGTNLAPGDYTWSVFGSIGGVQDFKAGTWPGDQHATVTGKFTVN